MRCFQNIELNWLYINELISLGEIMKLGFLTYRKKKDEKILYELSFPQDSFKDPEAYGAMLTWVDS